MPTIHPNHVREGISLHRIQKQELAQRAGLNKNSVTGIERPGWNPKWDTLTKLCSAVDDIKRERAEAEAHHLKKSGAAAHDALSQ